MEVRCLSYNVKGLNSPGKSSKVLKEVQRYGADIVFLQETHLVQEEGIKLDTRNYPAWIYCDTPTKRAKGVVIGFSQRTKFTLLDKRVDIEGLFLFIKIKLGGKIYTLANIYCPNRDPIKYLSRTLNRLVEFREGEVILAGDFNLCIDPALDRSSGIGGEGHNQLSSLRRKLHDSHLIDVWRVQHPKERDYTIFSLVHGTYSRLDYLMVDHSLLDSIAGSRIETMTLSDHAPVIMTVRLEGLQKIPFTWRLNEKLLEKDNIVERIQQEIDEFFLNNDSEEIPGAVIWETFKAYIRGVSISMGGDEKEVLSELIIKRDELRELVAEDSFKIRNKYLKNFHQRGNKVGKHLAATVRKMKGENYIEKIKNKKGESRYTTRDIGEEFRQFFASLYSVGWSVVSGEEHKLAAFADDVLFYISNPRISIPNLLAILRQFSELSNFKINLEKSEALKININKHEASRLAEVFHFPWRDNIKYLGVKLASSRERLYKLNFIPLLNEIRAEIKRIFYCPVSWIGQVNIVKMVLAPKVLYKMQMLPIPIPQDFFRILTEVISRYVWDKKKV